MKYNEHMRNLGNSANRWDAPGAFGGFCWLSSLRPFLITNKSSFVNSILWVSHLQSLTNISLEMLLSLG